MAAILASSSEAGFGATEDMLPVLVCGKAGRAVRVRGWKNRRPLARGTRFTITEEFLGIIMLSSKYSIGED